MTHEEKLAKIKAENERKEAAKAETTALKISNPSPKAIPELLARIEKIEKLLGV